MPRLLDLFRLIDAAANREDISVRRLGVESSVWVGRDSMARPVVIIETLPDGGNAYSVVLRNLSFEPWATCKISENINRREIPASIIRCTGTDIELQEHFLRALSPACEEFGLQPRVSNIALVFQTLVEVFQALTQPASKSLQGLWAELALVLRASNLQLAILSWQPRARSLVDFEHAESEVEVKSCVGPIRRHRFKLAQLQPKSGVRRFIASFILTSREDGLSINDLWDRIVARLDKHPELKSRLTAQIAIILGEDWRLASMQRYDDKAAFESLRVFDTRSIPSVGQNIDPAVTDVEFSADLSGAIAISNAVLVASGRLPESLFSVYHPLPFEQVQ